METTQINTYLDLCTQVYDLSKPHPPKDAYEFYRSYVAQTKGPILEPMCGTGRFLLPLLEEGFNNVQGSDASAYMLDALYSKGDKLNIKFKAWRELIQDFKRQESYDLIFIPSGSFGLITDQAVAKASLENLYNHLSHDGILLFEGETLKGAPKDLGKWSGLVWPKADGSMILQSMLPTLTADLCSIICKYELIKDNKIIQTEIEDIKIRLYDNPATVIEILKEIGFRDVKTLKAFDRNASPDKDSDVIIYECRK